MTMTRLKAAGTHLLISATLSTVVICLLLFGWYPLPFFWALGGLMLLVLIIGIDVVMGPVMTLILFNPKKTRRALLLDLSLIAIVQISALVYGLYSGYLSRLVFIVFDGQSFQLVQAGDVAGNFLQETKLPAYKTLPQIGYETAAISVPNDDKAKSDLAFYRALGVGPQSMPNYYVPLIDEPVQIKQAAISTQQLQQQHTALYSKIDSLLTARRMQWQQVAVVPVNARTATYTAVVDPMSGTLLTILRDDPTVH
jgi:hypothetical protein